MTSLEGYEKIKTVGKGAFGTAVLYRQVDTGSLVVMKEIDMLELKPSERQMALNEVRVLSSLSHPNIIRYLGSWEHEGVLRIEMEYAAGGTLAQLITRSSHLAEQQILQLFLQCVAAISYMHDNNILHRDLKTANVFLTEDNVIKVGDFGISKVMTTVGQAQTVLGTPYYISPEMCEGKQYDNKSDVWALGCILYEMACLQKTFQGNSLPVLVSKIMKGNFDPIPSQYSDDLKNLVRHLLQKNPALRPTAAETYELVNSLLDKNKPTTDIFQSDKITRSVLYQISGNGMSFSCVPTQLLATLKITQVASSNTHYVVLSSDQTVFSWGEGKRGQLGHVGVVMWLPEPTLITDLIDSKITQVGAGDGFSVFLSEAGVLMTCGDGTFGCLGHGDYNNLPKPKVIEKMLQIQVRQVTCGDNHCLALTFGGELFVWGRGDSGRLGIGVEEDRCTPTLVPTTHTIKSIHAGTDCSAFITETGTVYASGNNAHNKLGLSSSILLSYGITKNILEKSLTFQQVNSLSSWRIVDISLGANHSAALTDCGRVVTMGSNKEAQTGHDSVVPRVVLAIEELVAVDIACGPTYTVVTSAQNVLYYWGTRYTQPVTDASMLEVETATQPEQLLALYASQSHIASGEMLTIRAVSALWDTVLVLVDTTVPLAEAKEVTEPTEQVEFDSIGPIPQWITAELEQARDPWDENLFTT